jgi:AcrR family transcriptional regulator
MWGGAAVPKVSQEHKAGVRDRLLDAAWGCLLEKGLEGMTTREVLERAGMSAGTLYHYFSGKDDLVMALAERIAETEFGDLGEAEDDVDLLALTGRLLGVHEEVSVLPELRVRARLDADVRRALARYDELTIGRFVPLVVNAQERGLLAPDLDAAAVVELVELLFEALQSHAAAGTFVTSHERVVGAFLSMLSTLEYKGVPT